MTSSDLSHLRAQCAEPTVDQHSSSRQLDLLNLLFNSPKESEMLKIQQVFYRVFWPLVKTLVFMDSNRTQSTARRPSL